MQGCGGGVDLKVLSGNLCRGLKVYDEGNMYTYITRERIVHSGCFGNRNSDH